MRDLDQAKLESYCIQLQLFIDLTDQILSEVAKSADTCLAPFRHGVFYKEIDRLNQQDERKTDDLILRVESRNVEGVRAPENDLEIEIFRSGVDISLTLLHTSQENYPILWQGKYSFWMDSETGKKVESPSNGIQIEALARRLRASFLCL